MSHGALSSRQGNQRGGRQAGWHYSRRRYTSYFRPPSCRSRDNGKAQAGYERGSCVRLFEHVRCESEQVFSNWRGLEIAGVVQDEPADSEGSFVLCQWGFSSMKHWIRWISKDVMLRPCIVMVISMTGSITNETLGCQKKMPE